jgi:hypothetical protein
MSMNIRNPFFTVGTFLAPASGEAPVTPGEVSTAVAAMNAACFGPNANMAQCAILSESLGLIHGNMACGVGGDAAAAAAAASAAGLAATAPRSSLSGPTVMAALAALGSQPGVTGLARLC